MKKFLMMAVMSGMVFANSQIILACQRGETGSSPEIVFATKIALEKSLREAVQKNNVKTLLESGAANFCKETGTYNFISRLQRKESCGSPSDDAFKLGFDEIALRILDDEENRTLRTLHYIIDNNIKDDLMLFIKNYEQSNWFRSELHELIAYAEKFEKFEAAQLLKEFQAQHQETTPN